MNFLRKLCLIVLLLGAGAGGLWIWQQRKPAAKQDLTSLRTQLDAAAERNFLVPSLEVKRVEITVGSEKVEPFIQKTIKRAEGMGGTAMQGLDREGSKVIMATLPKNRLQRFLASLEDASVASEPVDRKGPVGEMVDCEILIRSLEK